MKPWCQPSRYGRSWQSCKTMPHTRCPSESRQYLPEVVHSTDFEPDLILSSRCQLIDSRPRLLQLAPHPQPLEQIDCKGEVFASGSVVPAQDVEAGRQAMNLP